MSVHVAAVLVAYDSEGSTVVGTRRADLQFLPGFTVFPGGRVDTADAELARALGGDPGDPLDIRRAAALRELLEEVRLFPVGRHLRQVPAALHGAAFMEVAAALDARPSLRDLVPIARWVTPRFSEHRYDTTYFALACECVDEPVADPREFADAQRVAPDVLMAAWRRFERIIAPPTMVAVEALARTRSAEGLAELLRAAPGAQGEDVAYVQCLPGIRQIPLETPTLPPARHTNTYLVGTRRFLIVDPATYDVDEQGRLFEEIARLRAEGPEPWMVFLTHHHGDHIGSALRLRETLGIPIAAHAETARLLESIVPVDVLLADGDRLELGSEEDPFPVELWHTPGHAAGHLTIVDRRPGARALIVGDMVASVGTIIIDPSEGNMAEYLRQLARLRRVERSVLFPAHGLPVIDGPAKFDQYIAHRLMREAKVAGALERLGEAELAAITAEAYEDTPLALHGLASRSCLAHLEKLVEDGRAAWDGAHFSPRLAKTL